MKRLISKLNMAYERKRVLFHTMSTLVMALSMLRYNSITCSNVQYTAEYKSIELEHY